MYTFNSNSPKNPLFNEKQTFRRNLSPERRPKEFIRDLNRQQIIGTSVPQNPGNNNNTSFRRNVSRDQFNNSFTSSKSPMNKTTTSVHSDLILERIKNLNIITPELEQLLVNQQRNLKEFKRRIQIEKNRVNTDMEMFKKQIIHVTQDFKLSVLAQMDNIYKEYMDKYSRVKYQLQEFKIIRQEIQREIEYKQRQTSQEGLGIRGHRDKSRGRSRSKSPHKAQVQKQKNMFTHRYLKEFYSPNNQQIVKAIEDANKDIKKYHIYNYISELQKSKLQPLQKEINDLVILNEFQNGFYQPGQMQKLLLGCKNALKKQLRYIYDGQRKYLRSQQSVLNGNIQYISVNGKNPEKQQPENVTYANKGQFQANQAISKNRMQHQIDGNQGDHEKFINNQFIKQRTRNPQYSQHQKVHPNYQFHPTQPLQNQKNRKQNPIRYPQSQQGNLLIKNRPTQKLNNFQPYQETEQNRSDFINDASFQGYQPEHEQVIDRYQPNQLQFPQYQYQNPVQSDQVTADLQPIQISNSQQVALYRKLNPPRLYHSISVKPVHSDQIPLCAIFLPKGLFAIGNRDGKIGIYSLNDGSLRLTLQGHRASVCSLAIVVLSPQQNRFKTLLASGSDYGCNSIIMWDVQEWKVLHKTTEHKAAVTSIVDFKDGKHFASGSYDKRINVYSTLTGEVKYSLPANKSSVTSMVLNSTGSKMISCNLDNTLNVWQIVRRSTMQTWQQIRNEVAGLKDRILNQERSRSSSTATVKSTVDTLFLERVIQNNTMICSLVGSLIKPDTIFIGTKDGKIKIINIDKGENSRTIQCFSQQTAVIQVLALERQNNPNYPLLAIWPCLEQDMKFVNTQTRQIFDSGIPIDGYIEFGCGVGPKSLLLNSRGTTMIGMLSHSQNSTFNVYSMGMRRQLIGNEKY